MNLPQLILASASPRRSELLRQLDVEFEVIPSDAIELHNEQLTAGELCRVNAYRKARPISKRFPDAIVMGADTLVYLGNQLFGKPKNRDEAHGMLQALQGETHLVVTGVCLMHLRSHRHRVFAETTQVTFRSLNDAQIAEYLNAINPLDKAGAYAIQEHGEKIVEQISGSFTNVVGLPLEHLREELSLWEIALGTL
ncbi:Maf family protein [Pedosphaera parvula]|nr:Maf family protein [Pedosphaera parvula]